MDARFTLVHRPSDKHYALYDNGSLAATWGKEKLDGSFRDYIQGQIEMRSGGPCKVLEVTLDDSPFPETYVFEKPKAK